MSVFKHRHVVSVHSQGEVPLTHSVFVSGVASKDDAENLCRSRGLKKAYWHRRTARLYYNPLEVRVKERPEGPTVLDVGGQ